jgi:thiamine biosynthesis protein ThiI
VFGGDHCAILDQPMKFVIKLFPEIIVKSRPVRKQFISQLRKNLKKILSSIIEQPQVHGIWDRLEVDLKQDDYHLESELIAILQRTPGIEFILKVTTYQLSKNVSSYMDEIAQIVIKQYKDKVKNKTFCLRAKRTGAHPFKSIEMEHQIGGALYQNSDSAGVKLKDPEVLVQLELKEDQLFAVQERFQGLGGFPIGQQESCVSLISGGFDSTVSSYLMIKRGIRTHYLFFNLGGIAHDVGVKQVAHYLWDKYASSHRVLFITIPFEPVVSEILKNVDHSQMGVILKRMMLRVADKVAEEFNAPAIVTGEAVGKVSSQTLTNLSVIDKVSNILVMRPLIVMDKPDIVELSRKIGTEEFAAVMPEYCGIIVNKPTTRAKIGKIEKEEKNFDFEILDQSFLDRKIENMDQIYQSKLNIESIEVVNLPNKDDTIIDIRHPHELATKPLILTKNEVLTIPFFKLQYSEKIDKNKTYLLYCDKGVMSQLQAEELFNKGFKVKIYQP